MMRMWPVDLIGFETACTTSCPCVKPRQVRQVLGDRLAGDREAVADRAGLSSSSSFITAGVPPTLCKSSCTYLPLGRRSARYGTRSLVRWKSSIVSGTSTARAIAMRCSTALVEPPTAITTAIAFSNASRVITSRGLMSFSMQLRIDVAGAAALVQLAGIGRRQRRAVRQRHAHRFDRRGHRVGGVHAAARAGAGTGVAHDFAPLGVGHLAQPVVRRNR